MVFRGALELDDAAEVLAERFSFVNVIDIYIDLNSKLIDFGHGNFVGKKTFYKFIILVRYSKIKEKRMIFDHGRCAT